MAEAGGGAARHTRAWLVGRPAVVADCRRLRLSQTASKVPAIAPTAAGPRTDQCRAVPGPSEVPRGHSTATDTDRRAAVVYSETPGQKPPTIWVNTRGWTSGKMGCFFLAVPALPGMSWGDLRDHCCFGRT